MSLMPSAINQQQHQQSTDLSILNGSFEDHPTLNDGEDFRIFHFNIEGIFKAKRDVLTKITRK